MPCECVYCLHPQERGCPCDAMYLRLHIAPEISILAVLEDWKPVVRLSSGARLESFAAAAVCARAEMGECAVAEDEEWTVNVGSIGHVPVTMLNPAHFPIRPRSTVLLQPWCSARAAAPKPAAGRERSTKRRRTDKGQGELATRGGAQRPSKARSPGRPNDEEESCADEAFLWTPDRPIEEWTPEALSRFMIQCPMKAPYMDEIQDCFYPFGVYGVGIPFVMARFIHPQTHEYGVFRIATTAMLMVPQYVSKTRAALARLV